MEGMPAAVAGEPGRDGGMDPDYEEIGKTFFDRITG